MNNTLIRRFAGFMLAASISVLAPAYAGPGDVNSINNTTNVTGGTYYNTDGTPTVFNATGSGLVVGAGTTVRGLEVANPVDPVGSLTGNGGFLRFNAPGQIVRIDGTVDASALLGGGFSSSNGGRVEVNSAYLYQNGQIYANGTNGGLIQFNVGSATFTPNSITEAKGWNGNGGVIQVNANGPVNVQADAATARRALLDSSGRVIGDYDSNVISIQGSAVNVYGILRADGIRVDGVASSGGKILLVANSENLYFGPISEVTANGADGQSGDNPTDGGAGGLIDATGHYSIITAAGSKIQANGGNGGNAGPVIGDVTTVTDPGGITLTIGKFNHHADPDRTDLNKLQPGVTQTQIVEGFTKSIAGGTLTVPTLTAQATYASDGSSVTVVIKQGDSVLKTFTYNPTDKSPFGVKHDTITFNATLDVDGLPLQTVVITRDFNLQTAFNQPQNEPNVNLVFLPHHLGGTISIPSTHTEQIALGKNGGNGGDGGTVLFTYGKCPPLYGYPAPGITHYGSIEAKGGNGGNGGDATATTADVTEATGGDGGNGGDGGLVKFIGPSAPTSGSVNVAGGLGGAAGQGFATDTTTDGSTGQAGEPGTVEWTPLP